MSYGSMWVREWEKATKRRKREKQRLAREAQKVEERIERERIKAQEREYKALQKAKELQEKERIREQQRKEKERIREQERKEKEELKKELEAYVEIQMKKAAQLQMELEAKYDNYNKIREYMSQKKRMICFEIKNFYSTEKVLSKTEAISRQIEILYIILTQKEILSRWPSINYFKRRYDRGEIDAIEYYMELVMRRNDRILDFIDKYICEYSSIENKAYIKISFKNKEDIFAYKEVKYIKSSDNIKYINMGVTEKNTRMMNLMENIVMSVADIFFSNNTKGYFDKLVVNAFHQGVCYMSLNTDTDRFYGNGHCVFSDGCYSNEHYGFSNSELIISKNINKGIKDYKDKYLRLE